MDDKKLTHFELIEIGKKWLKQPYQNAVPEGHAGCATILSELVTAADEIPDIIGWNLNGSILIEAKTSLADFHVDKKKPWRSYQFMGMGDRRYYFCEKGVIPIEEIKDEWGLLEVVDRKVIVSKNAEYVDSNKQKEIMMLLSHIRRIKIKTDIGIDEPDITVTCPRCGITRKDYDGFGILYCTSCGYCVHASRTDGICDYYFRKQEKENEG